MSLRVSLVRCGRILQQTNRLLATKPLSVPYALARRSIHVYPPLRHSSPNPSSSNTSNSTSAETPSPTEQPKSTPEESAEPVAKVAEETSPNSKDIPPPLPKRDVDPKDH